MLATLLTIAEATKDASEDDGTWLMLYMILLLVILMPLWMR